METQNWHTKWQHESENTMQWCEGLWFQVTLTTWITFWSHWGLMWLGKVPVWPAETAEGAQTPCRTSVPTRWVYAILLPLEGTNSQSTPVQMLNLARTPAQFSPVIPTNSRLLVIYERTWNIPPCCYYPSLSELRNLLVYNAVKKSWKVTLSVCSCSLWCLQHSHKHEKRNAAKHSSGMLWLFTLWPLDGPGNHTVL